jgi:hypothetical protein
MHGTTLCSCKDIKSLFCSPRPVFSQAWMQGFCPLELLYAQEFTPVYKKITPSSLPKAAYRPVSLPALAVDN